MRSGILDIIIDGSRVSLIPVLKKNISRRKPSSRD